MTIWHALRTYKDDGVYYQVLPYNIGVLKALFCMEYGTWQVIKFMKNSRLTERGARKLANAKNNSKSPE